MTEPELPSLTLSFGDRESALWKKLEPYMTRRLEMLRRRNEADLNDIETAKLRGRILELKSLLALQAPAEKVSDSETEPESW